MMGEALVEITTSAIRIQTTGDANKSKLTHSKLI
jgi:hypothetical protein